MLPAISKLCLEITGYEEKLEAGFARFGHRLGDQGNSKYMG